LVIAGLGAALLAAPGVSLSQPTSPTQPYRLPADFTFVDACNGQTVESTGTITEVTGMSNAPDGSFRAESHLHYAGTAVGADGTRYRVLQNSPGKAKYTTDTGTLVGTSTLVLLFISEDGKSNFISRPLAHVVIDDDGKPSLQVGHVDTECVRR
jgi:hypothetical protein